MNEDYTEVSSLIIPEIELDGYFFGGNSPVQAEGKVKDKEFYFRSRYSDCWSFAIALRVGVFPEEIEEESELAFFRSKDSDNVRMPDKPPYYMSFSEAKRIIIECVNEYFEIYRTTKRSS
jgi:hypothetical protein